MSAAAPPAVAAKKKPASTPTPKKSTKSEGPVRHEATPSSSVPLVQFHIFVSGKVQGVFFRKYTHLEAQKLGLTGWVRNLDDGRVEIVAQGSRPQLELLERWCHKGSPKSNVTSVTVEVLEHADEVFKTFVIDRSGGGD